MPRIQLPVLLVRGKEKAWLKETLDEVRTYRRIYWAPCLALLDANGRWMSSEKWKLNGARRALKYAQELGWKIEKEK